MTPTKHISASAVILAAGHSRRMASDKAWLNHAGQSLIARQLHLLHQLKPVEIFISGRPEQNFARLGCPVLLDNFPDSGPLSGIERALEAASAPLLLVLAVDMPAITARFLRQLYGQCSSRRSVLSANCPTVWNPSPPFYPKTAHSTALRLLGEGQNSASGFARFCAELGLVALVEVALRFSAQFANWNHPSDLLTS